MYKIEKKQSVDWESCILPVATVPLMLRNEFQFFVGKEKLRYFSSVRRHTQSRRTLQRVAIVIQNKLVLSDIRGQVKRCIDIINITEMAVKVVDQVTKILFTIPSEYDLLIDVIRNGDKLLRAVAVTNKLLGGDIKFTTRGIPSYRKLTLSCPRGQKKQTAFELLGETFSISSEDFSTGSAESVASLQRTTNTLLSPSAISLTTETRSELLFPKIDRMAVRSPPSSQLLSPRKQAVYDEGWAQHVQQVVQRERIFTDSEQPLENEKNNIRNPSDKEVIHNWKEAIPLLNLKGGPLSPMGRRDEYLKTPFTLDPRSVSPKSVSFSDLPSGGLFDKKTFRDVETSTSPTPNLWEDTESESESENESSFPSTTFGNVTNSSECSKLKYYKISLPDKWSNSTMPTPDTETDCIVLPNEIKATFSTLRRPDMSIESSPPPAITRRKSAVWSEGDAAEVFLSENSFWSPCTIQKSEGNKLIVRQHVTKSTNSIVLSVTESQLREPTKVAECNCTCWCFDVLL